MKTTLVLAALVPMFVSLVACSSSPTEEDTSDSSQDLAEASIVSRGMEWVNAKLHYCQAAHNATDGDTSCWGFEGSSHRCDRESNAAWNAYRSDCSGFVSFAWGLPPVGSGGYVTGNFAPFSSAISHTINGIDLRPGDALNKTDNEHIILFKEWTSVGHTAVFMEEPGCSSSTPYAHEFSSSVSISGDKVYVSYEGASFYAIRSNASTVGGSGGSGGGGSTGGGGGSTGETTADSCSKGNGFCTPTIQCDGGHWIARTDDPTACATEQNIKEPCSEGNGYCTQTLQCDDGYWIPRAFDSAACTSGPGAR